MKSLKLLLRYNLISAVFLGLFSIPGIGTEWLDFVLPASCFAVIPLLLTIREVKMIRKSPCIGRSLMPIQGGY